MQTKSGLQAVASKLSEEQANLDSMTQERQEKQKQLEKATEERDKLEQASKQNVEALSKLDVVEESVRNTTSLFVGWSHAMERWDWSYKERFSLHSQHNPSLFL